MNDQASDTRTMQDLVRGVILLQDGVNLSGIVHSFSRDITRLRQLLQGETFNTGMLNRHPVCVMYSSKIAQLSGSEVGLRFTRAYEWCRTVQETQGDLPPLPVDAD